MKRYLVTHDGSEPAAAAYEFALDLAAGTGAEIELLHSVEIPGPVSEALAFDAFTELEAEGREHWQKRLDEFAAQAPDGMKVQATILTGHAASIILDHIDSSRPDLVLSGTHGVGGARKYLLGGVSQRLLQHSSAPVLLIREKPDPAPSSEVLVGVDGSDAAAIALDAAQKLAVALGAGLRLVNVVDPYLPGFGTVRYESVKEQLQGFGRDIVKQARDLVAAPLDAVSEEIREGDPGDEMVAACKEHRPLAVVVGTQGVHGVAGLFVGSVTRDLVNHAPVPVLVVREND